MIKQEMDYFGLTELPDLDYSFLEERAGLQLRRTSSEVINRIANDLQKEKQDLEVQLENKNIGITDRRAEHSNEKELEEEIQTMIEQIKEADTRKNELTEKLDQIKNDRKAVFMDFMNELKPSLQSAYEILTKKDNATGRVDVFIENTDFPCD